MIELRHLRYFVAVAEELHFGRAALRLHVAQPGLSQQIKSLERELGVCLFERTKRQVSLTRAGSVFLAEARATLSRLDQALETMREFRPDTTRRTLRAGMFPACRLGPALVRELRRRGPQIALALEHSSTEQLLRGVEHGELQLAVVRSVPEQSRLCKRLLAREPLGVCLPARHRLAARNSITAAALRDEPLIWFRRTANPLLYDHTIAALDDAGLHVGSVQQFGSQPAALALVAEGLGWTLTCQSELAESNAQELAWRPFADVELVAESWAIWSRTANNPDIAHTVDVLAEICSRPRLAQ